MTENPLVDAIGELTDAQLRRIVALLGLRCQRSDGAAPEEEKRAA